MRIIRTHDLVRDLICFFTILISLFGVSSYTLAQGDAPVISLAGPSIIAIDQGQTYPEPGYYAFDFNGIDISNNVIIICEWGNVSEPINVPGTYIITYDVSDANGAAEQKTRTVTVIDTEDPIITVTGENPDTVSQGAVYSDPGATARDNGNNIEPVIAYPTNLDTSEAGPATITYTIEDAEGNFATATRTVNILDTEAPVISLRGANPLIINQGTTYTEPNATVTDNVDGNSINPVISGNVDTSIPDTYTMYYDAVDTAGNIATQVTRTVIVKDTEDPIITVTGENPDTVSQGAVYSDPGATARDNGNNIGPVIASPTNLDTSNAGPATITYTIEDAEGNFATATRTVNILDTEAPVISLRGANPLEINQGVTFIDPGFTASDNVDGDVINDVIVSGNVNTAIPDIYTRTYTVTDSSSNPFTITRQVIVNDTERPVIRIDGDNPFNISQNQAFNDPGVTVTDNIDDESQILPSSTGTVDITTPGQYNITYQATDTSGNEAISKTRVVVVSDSEKPVITLLGANPITIDQGTTYNEPSATAFDSQDGTRPVTTSGNVDTSIPDTYTMYYDAVDTAGNTAIQVTRTVIVKDTEDPIITVTGENPDTVSQGAVYSDPGATARDNGNNIEPVIAYPTNLDTSEAGPATITYTIEDAEGNSATATRTVNILDTEAPVISLRGANPLIINQGTNTYTEPNATVTDNVDGNSINPVISGNVDTSIPDTYTMYYDAVDTAGNIATQVTRTVIVKDTEDPIITVTGENPDTVSQGAVYSDPGATARDNGNNIEPVIASPTNLDTSNAGPATITYTIEDAEGNFATATRTVNILDTEAPVISLRGANPLIINQGTTYTEPNATVTDNVDGNSINPVISGNVDTSIPDTYTMYYDAVDTAGNIATQVTRTVIVKDTEDPIITVTGENPDTVSQGAVYSDPGATARDNGNNIGASHSFPNKFGYI
jgi:hypothetical protein